mgnify:FL=1
MSFQKKTTVVQNTGLGDDQYNQIQKNQGGIDDNLKTGFTGVGTRFNTVDTGIADLKTGIGGITSDVNVNTDTGFTNLTDTLSGYNDDMTGRFNTFDQTSLITLLH